MNTPKTIASIAVFLTAFSVFAGNKAPVESGTHYVRDAVQPFVDKGWCPGAISVLYKDGVQEVDCIGYADVAKKRPIKMDDPFMQCSQTKGFCGVTVAILVEEGKLNLDDPVIKAAQEVFEKGESFPKKPEATENTKKQKTAMAAFPSMNGGEKLMA